MRDGDHRVYKEIWRERPHKCIVTGDLLGKEPLTTFFHHLLPKEKYPQYRHEKWNIVLVSPFIHTQIENGVNIPLIIRELYLEALKKHRTFTENQED